MTTAADNAPAWLEWRRALASGRMPHGWLFAGAAGLGKARFARAAAAERVAEPGVPQPGGDSHPDIITLKREAASKEDENRRDEGKPFATKRNITVDQVRAMQRRLTTRPTLGPRRVIIIDSADDLERSAANALLKSLEEPPAGSQFMLISHRPGRLLPTIRSRCRILRFPRLTDADVERVIERHHPDLDPWVGAGAIAAARGSPGAALAFIEQDLAAMHEVLAGIAAHGDADFVRRAALAGAVGARPDRDRLLACVGLARSICARRLPSSEAEEQRRLIDAHAQLVRLGSEIPYANYDARLAVSQIGALLARAAPPRQAAR